MNEWVPAIIFAGAITGAYWGLTKVIKWRNRKPASQLRRTGGERYLDDRAKGRWNASVVQVPELTPTFPLTIEEAQTMEDYLDRSNREDGRADDPNIGYKPDFEGGGGGESGGGGATSSWGEDLSGSDGGGD